MQPNIRIIALLLIAIAPLRVSSQEAQRDEILLWPNGAPDAPAQPPEEKVRVTDGGDHVISSVHRPSITAYLPSTDDSNLTAVIIAPGGGHRELWSDHEGHWVAKELQAKGIAAFVLKYRLASEEGSAYDVDKHAVADLQRAIQVVRHRSDEWKINRQHVGAMGFSAGGELVAMSGMNFSNELQPNNTPESQSDRPDFQALIYPGRSHRYEPHKNSPPAFIACGFKDRDDIAKGMANVYLKFKELGVPAELHIYSEAGHGFGIRAGQKGAVSHWLDHFVTWLHDRDM